MEGRGRDQCTKYGSSLRTEGLLESHCRFLSRGTAGSELFVEDHSGHILVNSLVEGKNGCETPVGRYV